LRKHLESDDESANLVTNWMLESNFSSEEFEDYHQALSMFNNISRNGTQVILYEIKKSPLDGSIVKKTPVLNSKKAKTKSRSFNRITYRKSADKSDDHQKNKNKFKDFKVRIFLLIIVLLTFIVIIFFMNSIAGESSNDITVHQSILFRIDNLSYFLHL
jgi:cell division protein FtsX